MAGRKRKRGMEEEIGGGGKEAATKEFQRVGRCRKADRRERRGEGEARERATGTGRM